MKTNHFRCLAGLSLALLLAGCQAQQPADLPISVAPHTVSEETQELLHLMPQGDSTFFFDVHLDESIDALSVQHWTLNDDHQWTENEEVGVSGLLDHSDQVLMIQVLTEQSSYAWSYGGVTSSLIPITEDESYFDTERGFRSLSRLNTQTEVTVGKPVPLLLIMEKNEGPDGRTTMDVNDIAQSLEHPEQIDADRALLITITFK